jgi:adenosine deaminase
MEEGERRHGVGMTLIPDIVRNVGREVADQTLEWALDWRHRSVVALGLSGFESEPDEPFAEHFATARDEGLHRVAHAGETQGPEAIVSALEVCLAERLGHGVRSVEDPALLERLIAMQMPLEVCPTSNLCLGVVEEASEHPFEDLRRAGAWVTVNSDDPPLFNTSLSEEYLRLAQTFDYDGEDLARFSLAALDAAFLSSERREELGARFAAEFRKLGLDASPFAARNEETAQ